MAKRTNALIFRYGITTFWKHQNMQEGFFLNILQIENIIYKELLKKNLNVLSIYYTQNLIKIFVFPDNDNAPLGGFNAYINNFSWFFFFAKSLNKVFFACCRLQQFKLIPVKYLLITKFLYMYEAQVRGGKPIHTGKGHKVGMQIKGKLKIKRSCLQFKLLGFKIRQIIFNLCGRVYNLAVHSICFSQGFFSRIKAIETKVADKRYYTLFIAFLAFEYRNGRVLTEHIANQLKLTKRHNRWLEHLTLTIKKNHTENRIKMLGMKLIISGKLNGRMRKKKYKKILGKILLQQIRLFVSYNVSISFTKYGVLCVKLWIINEKKKLH